MRMKTVGLIVKSLVAALVWTVSLSAQSVPSEWLREAADEERLARSAAPEAVSSEATVWVLGRSGFEVASEGTNGFHCMVRRLGSSRDVIPVCFNAAAAESVMPMYQRVVVEVALGSTFPAAWGEAMQRYESGEVAMPEAGKAVAYMMSDQTAFYNAQTDVLNTYFPHFMVYSPYLTGPDIGASQGQVSGVRVPFVAFAGQPGSYLMVPTGPAGAGIPGGS